MVRLRLYWLVMDAMNRIGLYGHPLYCWAGAKAMLLECAIWP